MGISKKSQGVSKKEYQVTNADLLNAVVISPTEFNFISIYEESDALFDGNIDVQQLQQDGSWISIQNTVNPNRSSWFVDGLSGGGVNGGAGAIKYPFQFRAIVTLKATQGTCIVRVNYL